MRTKDRATTRLRVNDCGRSGLIHRRILKSSCRWLKDGSRLMAVVHALPEADQGCLRLRAEGLRYREIAAVLGMSLGSGIDIADTVASTVDPCGREIEAMLSENICTLSDQELLLAADGELPTRRAAQVHVHLAACWSCRARMAEIEGTIADFARAHRQTLDPQLPPIAGRRALLRTQLAELASKRRASSWRWFFQFTLGRRALRRSICLGGSSWPQ